jgi:hypothetical protein
MIDMTDVRKKTGHVLRDNRTGKIFQLEDCSKDMLIEALLESQKFIETLRSTQQTLSIGVHQSISTSFAGNVAHTTSRGMRPWPGRFCIKCGNLPRSLTVQTATIAAASAASTNAIWRLARLLERWRYHEEPICFGNH